MSELSERRVRLGDKLGRHADRVRGEFSSRVPSKGLDGALEGLRRSKAYFTLDHVLYCHSLADWCGVDAELRRFFAAFQFRAEKIGVPLYCARALDRSAGWEGDGVPDPFMGELVMAQGFGLDICHVDRGYGATGEEWEVLGRFGLEVANDFKVKVDWGGHSAPYRPFRWSIVPLQTRLPPKGEPERYTPAKLRKLYLP